MHQNILFNTWRGLNLCKIYFQPPNVENMVFIANLVLNCSDGTRESMHPHVIPDSWALMCCRNSLSLSTRCWVTIISEGHQVSDGIWQTYLQFLSRLGRLRLHIFKTLRAQLPTETQSFPSNSPTSGQILSIMAHWTKEFCLSIQ